ncbi:8-oxo-dGDP phosphatase NUDT18 isoform 2-T2 [Thomomys bottae]
MASENPAGALAAVLGGQGLLVHRYDSEPPGHPPVPVRLRKNVCYVVVAVFLNEQDEVLLIQEAKRECRGTWYLPAGRMEPGETIVEAMRREVKEEAGLLCDPVTLLSVEERGPAWIRFVFLARPTGGTLKTSKEADAESLQAGWYPRLSLPSPLRARDVLYVVELAAQYLQQASHPLVLPQELPCSLVCQRLVATFTSVQTVWVLECLTLHNLAIETKGLLGLQHLGKDNIDGICMNVLVTVAFRNPGIEDEPPKVRGENYFWWKVMEEDLQKQLLQRLQDSSVVPVSR